jgi:hypothetical protein
MSEALVTALKDAWISGLRAGSFSGGGKRTYVYASRIRSCTRAMALDLTHPEDDGEFSDEALARMKRGEEREQAIVAWLHQIGPRSSPPFKVVEGQRRFEIKDRDGTVILVGKVDCRLQFQNGERPFVEVKAGESVRGLETVEDFDRSPWTRHMPDQLLSYCFAENQPWAFFVLDQPGLPVFIPMRLEDHLSRVERVLGQVRRAVDVQVVDAPLPEFTQDKAECRRCPHFKKSCDPPLDYGPGLKVITDETLIAAAELREKTREAWEQYERADKLLKTSLRGVDMALVGNFQARGQWQSRTRYEIPEELKEQYSKTDPHGAFRLTIERIAT